MATGSTFYGSERTHNAARDLCEVACGYGLIMLVLWIPSRPQMVLSPVVLIATLWMVMAYRSSASELGLDLRGIAGSLWIIPAALAFAVISILTAQRIDVFHPLYQADLGHVGGYILWTCYQQFLLQDLFMPRIARLLGSEWKAVAVTAALFAVAHLPNLPLTAITLLWGSISCLLFLRYRSVYVLGLAQGLLGLCFAVCVPDVWHHHMRVGLGYLHYHAALTVR